MSSKTSVNRPLTNATNSTVFNTHSPFAEATLVKVINDFEDDLLTARLNGRGTGFTGGYTSNIGQTAQSVMPTYTGWSGFTPLPNPTTGTGSLPIRMASTSTQDSSTGTGTYLYLVFMLDMSYTMISELVALNGTTPVTLNATSIYHFMYGFPLLPGSGFVSTNGQITSNVGTIFLGLGTTFSTTSGFSTVNYMWNRPNDGFLSSGVYVVPKNKRGTLWTVKFNSDNSVACTFKTYSRSSRSGAWSLNAEDNVITGVVIRRTLAGGFLPAGAEFTVIGNKTQATNNIAANFVMTCYEFSERCFSQGNADF